MCDTHTIFQPLKCEEKENLFLRIQAHLKNPLGRIPILMTLLKTSWGPINQSFQMCQFAQYKWANLDLKTFGLWCLASWILITYVHKSFVNSISGQKESQECFRMFCVTQRPKKLQFDITKSNLHWHFDLWRSPFRDFHTMQAFCIWRWNSSLLQLNTHSSSKIW